MMAYRERIRYDKVKRVLDVIGSGLGLILAIPMFPIIAFCIKRDGGPIFFTQVRVGFGGKPFSLLKLRTMVANATEMEDGLRAEHQAHGGYGVANEYVDPRITRIGAICRLLNLDELPQLINIMKGEMSLVGPRPVPYEESLLYGESRDEFLSVRPGLTGLWQVKRTITTDYDERIRLDSYYVNHRSALLDLYIMAMTPIAMLTSDYNSISKPLPPERDGSSLVTEKK